MRKVAKDKKETTPQDVQIYYRLSRKAAKLPLILKADITILDGRIQNKSGVFNNLLYRVRKFYDDDNIRAFKYKALSSSQDDFPVHDDDSLMFALKIPFSEHSTKKNTTIISRYNGPEDISTETCIVVPLDIMDLYDFRTDVTIHP